MQELANFVNVLLSYVRYPSLISHWLWVKSFWKFFKPDIASASILYAVISRREWMEIIFQNFFFTNAIHFIWVNVDKSYFNVVFDRSRESPFVDENKNHINDNCSCYYILSDFLRE